MISWDVDGCPPLRFDQVGSASAWHMPIDLIALRVMNEAAARWFDDAAWTLTNEVRSRLGSSAHSGSLFLLTSGVYKKWPDRSRRGCKAAAHANAHADAQCWTSSESHKLPWAVGGILRSNAPRPTQWAANDKHRLQCTRTRASVWWWLQQVDARSPHSHMRAWDQKEDSLCAK